MPILLHGDAVPIFLVGRAATPAFDVYSVQSCWVVEKVVVAKLYLFVFFSHQATEGGWTTIWKVVRWSLLWLSICVWRKYDHEGVPYGADRPAERDRAGCDLAEGFRDILYCLKAGLDHFARDYGLRRLRVQRYVRVLWGFSRRRHINAIQQSWIRCGVACRRIQRR